MTTRLIHGDCIEQMLILAEEGVKVDMVLCDMPYGATRNKWDSVLDMDCIWSVLNMVTADNTPVILFGSGMYSAKLMMSNKKMWRYNLIWKKGERTSGFLNANRMPMRNHEDILVFYGKQPVYNPQFTYGHKSSHKKGKLLSETNNCYGSFRVIETGDYEDRKFPKSVLNFDREHPPVHPT